MMKRLGRAWWILCLIGVSGVPAAARGDEPQNRNDPPARGSLPASKPTDERGLQTVAQSRYESGDLAGALVAWNQIGRPRIESVKVEGNERTDAAVILRAAALAPDMLLTPQRFRLAERRLDELPVVGQSTVHFETITNGRAHVVARITERPVLPQGWMGWASTGIRAVFQDELRVDVAGLTSQSEVTTGTYRWSSNRPRVGGQFAVPAPGGLPGVLRFDGSWERQSYLPDLAGDPLIVQPRVRAGVNVSDWITGMLRWQLGAAFDRIASTNYAGIDANLNARFAGDHVAAIASVSHWTSIGTGRAFSSTDLYGTYRSTVLPERPVWTTLAGVTLASDNAPLAVWPGAGSGRGRGALLRAHPLLKMGVLTGEAFGRRLAYSSTEYERPLYGSEYGTVSLAGFLDIARAWRRQFPLGPTPWLADIGGGIRFNTPTAGGKVRIDFAYGLRDGGVRLSAGYLNAWGRR